MGVFDRREALQRQKVVKSLASASAVIKDQYMRQYISAWLATEQTRTIQDLIRLNAEASKYVKERL